MAIKWLLESKIETHFALFWPRKLVKQSNKLYIAYTSSSSGLTHNGVAWIIQSSSNEAEDSLLNWTNLAYAFFLFLGYIF